MDPVKIDANDGVMVLELTSGAGPSTIRIDVYRAYHAYAACLDQHGDDVPALDAAWCEWLERNGCPRLTGWDGYVVAKAVSDRMADLKKKLAGPGSPRPDSPGSTGSPSAA
ncbi:unnamed protein product [Gemmataceae bacterium]|nr:unnamed protein product [Gemmataceae bacterium]VTT96565.1 unnamed protein product [Gemmataceae bacterium]